VRAAARSAAGPRRIAQRDRGIQDELERRKARGAFFTPPAIARYLAAWAVVQDPDARVLDPTCGEAVFLEAAGEQLKSAGCPISDLDDQIFGVDLHQESLDAAMDLLEARDLDARLIADDFFTLSPPDRLDCRLPMMDAVIGNPPFVRYQEHKGEQRKRSLKAALAQGVRLSGLASSWAALVVHACAFLKPEGRLAMVLPAELLTVGYAEPVRRWLKDRFAAVDLVLFERLQFQDVLEKVVLVVARGSRGCDSFSLHYVRDAEDLPQLGPFDHVNVTPAEEGKWTDMLLPLQTRQLFRKVVDSEFLALREYGHPELGTVTGANRFFTFGEAKRREFGIKEKDLLKISPPGTKHLRGTTFTATDWTTLCDSRDAAVWLLYPRGPHDPAIATYLELGRELGVHQAYKCKVRNEWWKPPAVPAPDLFFTYMSHRYPRLIANGARVTFVNSMHGVRLRPETPRIARVALPLLCLNSVSMLGAEVFGRSYGGGVLKMEPTEAAALPVPTPQALHSAWSVLKPERIGLDRRMRNGLWTNVAKRIDEVLLREVLGLSVAEVEALSDGAAMLRDRRLGLFS
jgi:adenine-specific DNA methylase